MMMPSTRTLVMGSGSFSLLAMGCGYAHNSVPLAMPSAAEQKVENADVGSEAIRCVSPVE